jgi:glycosyltransferase involved in cell wall biosynthesis
MTVLTMPTTPEALEKLSLPKTLIIELAIGYGGSTSRVLSLLEELPDDKIGLAALEGSAVAEYARARNLNVFIIGKRKYDPRILWTLYCVIKDEGFQVVDTQNIQSKFWGSLATSMAGIGLVSTLNSWYLAEHNGSLKGQIYQRLEFMTNRNLDMCITVSTMDYNRSVNANIPEDMVELDINTINLDTKDYPKDRESLLQEFDLPHDAIICAGVGRLVWQKGFSDLVEAVTQIIDTHPNIYCLIMGEGSLEEGLQQQIRDARLEKHIRLLGFVPRERVLNIVRSSDIFVMPSRYEGTPLALLEAAALECPIVATTAGGISELVTTEQHALLSAPEDISAFANNLSCLYQDADLRAKLAHVASNHVMQNFSPTAQAKKMSLLYTKAWQHASLRMEK